MAQDLTPVLRENLLAEGELQLAETVANVLAEARRLGADSASVSAHLSSGLEVEIHKGAVDKLEFTQGQGVHITLYRGKKKGTASTNQCDWQGVKEAIAKAASFATYTSEDPCAGLADTEQMATDFPDLGLYNPVNMTVEQAIEQATVCERAGLEYDGRIVNSSGAGISWNQSISIYGNSHGFVGQRKTTRYGISCALIGDPADGSPKQTSSWYDTTRDWQDLASSQSVGEMAASRVIAALSPQRIKTGKYPILFAPWVARSLFGCYFSGVSGGNLYKKTTCLIDTLNKPVFSKIVQIEEKPFLQKGLGSASFDGDGVATVEKKLVVDGVNISYLLDTYSARQLNMTTTGNAGGVFNAMVQPTSGDFDQMLKEMDRGLVITGLMGHGPDLVSGDFSQAAEGYWVEGGKIQHAVNEVTIASNIKDMFKGIVAIGSDIDRRGGIQTGSVCIEEMTVAGT